MKYYEKPSIFTVFSNDLSKYVETGGIHIFHINECYIISV